MKRIILAIVLFGTTMLAHAQTTMKDLWLSMPDSVLPYMNESMRRDHIDFINMNLDSEVKNLLSGKCVIDTLTTDYCKIMLNDNISWQLVLLPREEHGDSVTCSIKTFLGKGSESEICFYNQQWQHIDASFGLPQNDGTDNLVNTFIEKPDTMSQDRFAQLQSQLVPCMLVADYDQSHGCLVLKLSAPLPDGGQEEQVKTILKQRKLKWNGRMFTES